MAGAADLLSPRSPARQSVPDGAAGKDAPQAVRGAVGSLTELARAARTGGAAILISAAIVRGALVVLKT
jgi:hypothetical protein